MRRRRPSSVVPTDVMQPKRARASPVLPLRVTACLRRRSRTRCCQRSSNRHVDTASDGPGRLFALTGAVALHRPLSDPEFLGHGLGRLQRLQQEVRSALLRVLGGSWVKTRPPADQRRAVRWPRLVSDGQLPGGASVPLPALTGFCHCPQRCRRPRACPIRRRSWADSMAGRGVGLGRRGAG